MSHSVYNKTNHFRELHAQRAQQRYSRQAKKSMIRKLKVSFSEEVEQLNTLLSEALAEIHRLRAINNSKFNGEDNPGDDNKNTEGSSLWFQNYLLQDKVIEKDKEIEELKRELSRIGMVNEDMRVRFIDFEHKIQKLEKQVFL